MQNKSIYEIYIYNFPVEVFITKMLKALKIRFSTCFNCTSFMSFTYFVQKKKNWEPKGNSKNLELVRSSFQNISMYIWIIKNSYMRIYITLTYSQCTLKLIILFKGIFVSLFYAPTVPIFELRKWRHSICRRRNSFAYCNR